MERREVAAMIWRHGRRSPEGDDAKPAQPTLADACQAYVAGQYADIWQASSGSLPAWVRLNEVAHAPLAQLVSVARQAPSDGVATTWPDARARLARMLVDAAAHDEGEARRLQIEILQPLESRVGHLAAFVTPRRLIEIVEASLIGLGRDRDTR
jgi:hypothetical protein